LDLGIVCLILIGLYPTSMPSSLPPKPDHPLLKSCLIIVGSLAVTSLITFILIGIAFREVIRAMYPRAEEAAKLPINQHNSSDAPPPTDLNQHPFVAAPPLTTSDNRSLSPKKAMTWRVLNTATINGKQYALFGSDELTNPYQGDTDINEVRSLLCLQKDNLPAPLGLPTSTTTAGGALRGSWSGGRVVTVPDVQASTLTSQGLADEKCRLQGRHVRGEDAFRMAEFHDGDQRAGLAGWDFWAEVSSIEGLDNPTIRYWVQINDQSANPW
jgi:hypothetical protein